MANIRVDVNYTIKDGSEIVFRSPVDCSAITGLMVYYIAADKAAASREFILADAHGNNVGDIDHLFAENAVVKVILDVTAGMAYVQNADTNAYIEGTFVKSVNGVKADRNGNVQIDAGGLPVPSTAVVGQHIVVSAVDENGKVTETKTATIPATLPIPETAEVGYHIAVAAMDITGKVTKVKAVPAIVAVSDDGYTDFTGQRQLEGVRVVRTGKTVTMTTNLQGGVVCTDVITLDDNDYPVSLVAEGVECPFTWEGFDE